MIRYSVALLALLCWFATAPQASAQKITFKKKAAPVKGKALGAPAAPPIVRAPAPVDGGPTEPYIYKHSQGIFKLSAGSAEGVARYTFNGKRNEDKLELVGYGEISDPTGIGVPAGTTYEIWLYRAYDTAGNEWYLGFGVQELQGFPGRYGLYYARKDPQAGGTLNRWLLQGGTTRD